MIKVSVVSNFSGNERDNLIKSVVENMASNGLRTIGLAYKDMTNCTLVMSLDMKYFKSLLSETLHNEP